MLARRTRIAVAAIADGVAAADLSIIAAVVIAAIIAVSSDKVANVLVLYAAAAIPAEVAARSLCGARNRSCREQKRDRGYGAVISHPESP